MTMAMIIKTDSNLQHSYSIYVDVGIILVRLLKIDKCQHCLDELVKKYNDPILSNINKSNIYDGSLDAETNYFVY